MTRGTRPTRPSATPGFTLVELLAVMAIVVLLLSLLSPALVQVRRASLGVRCASQLRQVGIGLHAYASANSGQLPPWSGWQVYPDQTHMDDERGLGWTEYLQPYAGATPYEGLYQCPAFDEDAIITYFIAARWLNMHVPPRHSLKLSEVRLSSQFVLGGDCLQRSLYPAPFGTNGLQSIDCDKDDATSPCLLFKGEPGGWDVHPRGNNVLFADGHVEAHTRATAGGITFHPQRPAVAWAEVTP